MNETTTYSIKIVHAPYGETSFNYKIIVIAKHWHSDCTQQYFGYANTKWGAKRKARKIIHRIENEGKVIEDRTLWT